LSDGALREPHVRGKCCDEGCRHEKHIDVGECSLPSQSRVDLQARMIDPTLASAFAASPSKASGFIPGGMPLTEYS
jgi:hypothetical protein